MYSNIIHNKVEKRAVDLMKYGKYYSSISCTRALLLKYGKCIIRKSISINITIKIKYIF